MITKNSSVFVFGEEYMGLSTDEKPADAGVNAVFLELDTGDFYYYTGEEWAKIGG